jgi:hypothetical protein
LTRQLYELNHPLYPNQELLRYYNDHKILYQPYQGSYDDAYNNWYQLVRADHDISGAPKRPIYREISQIIRIKSSGKEFLKYSETLWGYDHEQNPIPFFHTYGEYTKPAFKKVYNYETKTASTIRSGLVETVYFIEYNKNMIDELYAAGPDNMDIELLVNVGSKQYGGRGFFTYDQFRDMTLEELGRIGNSGKGMFTTSTVNIPAGSMASELKALGSAGGVENQQSQLWKEFQEFQKFRQQQLATTTITPPPPSDPNVNSRIKIKATGEK